MWREGGEGQKDEGSEYVIVEEGFDSSIIYIYKLILNGDLVDL